MGRGINAQGQIVVIPDPTPQQRAAAEVVTDLRNAAKAMARVRTTLIFPPLQDPKVKGALWNNNGAPAISSGP